MNYTFFPGINQSRKFIYFIIGKNAEEETFMSGMIKLKPLAVCLVIPILGGFLSSWLSGDIKEVYSRLILPAIAPPDWVFPVAWTVLYLMIGTASYLIYMSRSVPEEKRVGALTFYGVQLVLNFLWTPLFFRFLWLKLAFAELIALIVIALFTTIAFYRINKRTFLLMLPYLIWLSYAAVLNKLIIGLNY